ncbi:MAG: hypothetical protein R3E79_34835 [Caldilineaceae bacterium]
MKQIRTMLIHGTLLLISVLTALLLTGQSILAQTPPADAVIIDEVILDPTTGQLTHLVISDGGIGATPLIGLVVVFLTDSDGTIIRAYDLANGVTNEAGTFTLGATGADLIVDAETLQTAHAVALYTGTAAEFTADSEPSSTNLLDMVIYTLGNDEEVLATHLFVPVSLRRRYRLRHAQWMHR